MKRGLLIIISGPAGSGKGTVIKELMRGRDNFAYSVSFTTRKPRKEDAEGKTYRFITTEQFKEKIKNGEMLEYAEYVGNYYGTPISPVIKALENGKNMILEIETQGALAVKERMPEAVSVMLLPPNARALRARLERRGTESADVIEKRLLTAQKEVSMLEKYDYVIINEENDPQSAAKKILGITNAETLRAFRNTEIKENYFD